MINEWNLFKKETGIIPLDKGERVHLDINKNECFALVLYVFCFAEPLVIYFKGLKA
jgi:hypothetical protein